MKKTKDDILIAQAMPGRAFKSRLPKNIERPFKLWVSKSNKWAIYSVQGDHWAKTTERAIRKLNEKGSIKPCILVSDSKYLGTVAKPFIKLKVAVIVQINGTGNLIEPRKINKKRKSFPQSSPRVPLTILEKCAVCQELDGELRELLVSLSGKYHRKRKWDDDGDDEQSLLQDFFLKFAVKNELSKDVGKAQEILRYLEQGSMRNDRDHYFHSFQNFFLGLWVIGEIKGYFEKWIRLSKLQWNVPLEFVWFLISMWHDVGYSIRSIPKLESDIFGIDLSENNDSISSWLSTSSVIEGKRTIASLMEHLLKRRPRTAWMAPQSDDIKTTDEERLENAIDSNIKGGHGAASALRLFTDMKHFINKSAVQDKRCTLMQATWLAAASIPFHDWHFRKCLRENMGECRVPALTMPFAALLTFIDSVQEDRRKFGDFKGDKAFLQGLSIAQERIISAIVDGGGLDEKDVIWKIVEATDVLAAIETNKKSIDIEYPMWLVA